MRGKMENSENYAFVTTSFEDKMFYWKNAENDIIL